MPPKRKPAAAVVKPAPTIPDHAIRQIQAAAYREKAADQALVDKAVQKYNAVIRTTTNSKVAKAARDQIKMAKALVVRQNAATDRQTAKSIKAIEAAAKRQKSTMNARANKAAAATTTQLAMGAKQLQSAIGDAMDWKLWKKSPYEIAKEFADLIITRSASVQPTKGTPKFIVYYAGDAMSYLDALANENGLEMTDLLVIEPMALIRTMPQFNMAVAKVVASGDAPGSPGYVSRIGKIALTFGGLIGQSIILEVMTQAFKKRMNMVLALDATTLTSASLIGKYVAEAKQNGYEASLFFPAVDEPTVQRRLDMAFAPIDPKTQQRGRIAWSPTTVRSLADDLNAMLRALYPLFATTTVVKARADDDGKEASVLMRIKMDVQCAEEIKNMSGYHPELAAICNFRKIPGIKRKSPAQRTYWQSARGKLLAGVSLLALAGGTAAAGYYLGPTAILETAKGMLPSRETIMNALPSTKSLNALAFMGYVA